MDSNFSKNVWGKKQEENKSSWGSSTSGYSTAGSGSNSLLTFGRKDSNSGYCGNKMDMSSSGGYSSNDGSWSRAQWSGIVEGVFKEEIGKMAQNK